MYTREELAKALAILKIIPEFGWLVSSEGKPRWVAVSAIANSYGQSKAHVERLCAVVPGAYMDDVTHRWRIPWSGLVVYFARKVAPQSFAVAA